MADIFVSYASEDRDRIRALVEVIAAEGWSVWWDRELVAGPSFEATIQRALDEARCVVVAWSKNSVNSAWCRDEAQEGLDREILVPVRIDDVRPPLGFRSSQTASLVGWPQERAELDNLLGGVRECVGTATVPLRPTVSSTETAIAVMPFRNMSNDPDQDFFSDGIAEDILNELARTSKDLIVRPPSASFALKGGNLSVEAIGERLRVSHVLEGSVRRAGNRIRVTAQLSEVARNRSIWSDRYDRELTDVFDIQDEITSKILSGLNLQFSQLHRSRAFAGTEAYDAFLRGLHHSRQFDFERAAECYEEAVTLNPLYADAWADWSRILGYQMSIGLIPNTGSYREQRKEYYERAIQIDPSHWALAHRAVYTFIEDREYQQAIDQLVEIVRGHPNSWGAVMYLTFALGGIDRQSEAYYRAAQRHRVLTTESDIEAQMLLDSGRTEEAQRVIEKLRRPLRDNAAARLAVIEHDVDGLEAILNQQISGAPMPHSRQTYYRALLAYLNDDFEMASKIVSTTKRGTGYQSFLAKHEIALIERDLDAAVDYYSKAIEAAEPAAMFWHRDTCFLNRVFPEFVSYAPYQEVLRDIGLDAESTAKIEIPDLPF